MQGSLPSSLDAQVGNELRVRAAQFKGLMLAEVDSEVADMHSEVHILFNKPCDSRPEAR